MSKSLKSSISHAASRAIAEYVESCDYAENTILIDESKARYKYTSSKEFHIGHGESVGDSRLKGDASCGGEIDGNRGRVESESSWANRIPPQLLGAMVVLLDGATTMVRDRKEGKRKFDVNYKVGTVGLYGEAVKAENDALEMPRTASSGMARLPEEKCLTFKKSIDAEVQRVCEAIPRDTIKLLLMDGAQPLWKHVEDNALHEDFLLLLDF